MLGNTALKNFAKFTVKHLHWSSFFNIKKNMSVLSCEIRFCNFAELAVHSCSVEKLF